MLRQAIDARKKILAEHFPRHVAKAVDDRLRARFGDLIRLPRSAMGYSER
jgi:trimethylamine--corrinoid protein Co-methyltransferase